MKYPKQFEPIKVGSITLKNRYVMAPMGGAGQAGSHGEFTDATVEYYTERARGGVGLIVTGVTLTDTTVDPVPPGVCVNSRQNPAVFFANATRLTDQVHAYGSKIFLQISMGLGRNAIGVVHHTPSELPTFADPSVKCPELTKEEIKTKIAGVIEAAYLAQFCGFDGVEIHAIHEGYLLDEFAMSFMNKRTDEYGGPLENRLRPAIEIVQGIKGLCGADFPVCMRLGMRTYIKGFNQASLSGDESEEVGRTLDEALEIAKILEKSGYDMLSLDSGIYDSYYWVHPPMYQPKGLNLHLAEACKKVVSIPVFVAGRMDSPEMCEEAIASGKTDGIVIGRALLADPEYCNKVEKGIEESIRPCLACHMGCCGRINDNKALSCAVNPQVLRETTHKILPAIAKKKVLVIGGGVGGMEAARIAKIRGHEVTLVEMSDKLGGKMIPAGVPAFKGEDRALIKWYEREMKRLSIDVRMNTVMSAEDILSSGADEVILAYGSAPLMPKSIKGIDSSKAISSIDALNGKRELGENVVVVGGGLVGCELALHLLQQGKKVTIVEMTNAILTAGKPIPKMNKMMLEDLLVAGKTDIRCGCSLKEITENGAIITSADGDQELTADDVVIAIGFKADNALETALKGRVNTYCIGDAKSGIGNVMAAIGEAFEVARNL